MTSPDLGAWGLCFPSERTASGTLAGWGLHVCGAPETAATSPTTPALPVAPEEPCPLPLPAENHE